MQAKKNSPYDKNPLYHNLETGKSTRDSSFQYYPPWKRKEIKDYLSKSSIRFQGACMSFVPPLFLIPYIVAPGTKKWSSTAKSQLRPFKIDTKSLAIWEGLHNGAKSTAHSFDLGKTLSNPEEDFMTTASLFNENRLNRLTTSSQAPKEGLAR